MICSTRLADSVNCRVTLAREICVLSQQLVVVRYGRSEYILQVTFTDLVYPSKTVTSVDRTLQ